MTAVHRAELTQPTHCGPGQAQMTYREAATRHRSPVAPWSLSAGQAHPCAVTGRLSFA
ncbi:hypothetical protein RA210_U10439 [Rubrivivax sp. A210]|nr:hypothetical protein RA210_U10439 [Rubrivivax sp. A210]